MKIPPNTFFFSLLSKNQDAPLAGVYLLSEYSREIRKYVSYSGYGVGVVESTDLSLKRSGL